MHFAAVFMTLTGLNLATAKIQTFADTANKSPANIAFFRINGVLALLQGIQGRGL